jgi:anti-sigma factor RsiW
MNGCQATQAKFTEYLDGRLNGREMQRIGAHLESCVSCAAEWAAMKQTQAALTRLGSVQPPSDLLLKIRVAVSQERARSQRSPFYLWNLMWKNSVAPFLFQASAGFASSVLLMGTVILMVGMFAQPERAQATKDEPLGNATAPHFRYISNDAAKNDVGALSEPVVVEAYINGSGRVYDYRIVSGPTDAATRLHVENQLQFSVFEPARFFGQPVRGLAILSFSGVAVRG